MLLCLCQVKDGCFHSYVFDLSDREENGNLLLVQRKEMQRGKRSCENTNTSMDILTSSSSSFPEPCRRHWLPIPRSYKFLKILGEGGFGKVVKCVKRGSEHTVAIKIGKNFHNLRQEASMLKVLMGHNLHKFNIIKFYGKFVVRSRTSLVFEMLDMTLQDYLLDLEGPMQLEDIRIVIQQMGTALSALKRIGVIHTDVKIDNIMMVDHVRQPFRVKLIDFGLAIFRSQAKPGKAHQTPRYRAPEIMLGLPFSEAIDIWSLGCVMAIMVLGFMLFPGKIEYDILRFIIDLLGPPPDHLVSAGRKSRVFFKKTDSDQWMLKTSEEYWGPTNYSVDDRFYTFRSLDEIKMMRLEKDNPTEADERRECIELLKAMLKWDEKERITPNGILHHPFITKSYLNSSSHLSSCSEPSESAAAEPNTSWAQTRTSESIVATQVDGSSETLPSFVIMVRPASPMNRIHLEETSDRDSERSPHPAAAPATALDATRIHKEHIDISPTTSDKKKKGKNCFKRFFSWMKRTVFSCCYADNVQE
ncbi:homeodomain-interacting protein kinase 1-like isoform X2 [Siniperca chuatsi]|uniref:homeodomain-interacting protein kinase 1-like isoform X2 n=1 Tax=Siniperca chuatsi TaxID=119488 RepID=UPI001CE1495B|nr:homeodomain-interacting protein kinase 1-like isoform X2 [Siniperca chuatsi]